MSFLLTCNVGSSTLKLALFETETRRCAARTILDLSSQDIPSWLTELHHPSLALISHRVVHGGPDFSAPTLITESVLTTLRSYIPLAPLHQPGALHVIDEMRARYPHLPHLACFDTAFHHSCGENEQRFPLPRSFFEEGIRRYGFHGLSYQFIASILPDHLGSRAKGRVIVAHLGAGASACAMKNLRSVATTMGFSSLDGLMMGTRCGSLDPGLILFLLKEREMTLSEITALLYHNSGLKGVSGISGDLQVLLTKTTQEARDAINLFCYLAAKQISSLLPSLMGLDALVFTGGIGEHSLEIREKITEHLRWIGSFSTHALATNEESVMANAGFSFLEKN